MPRDQKIQGIYAIVNETTGERYIGQSTNIESRWRSHKRDFCFERHHNPRLQKDHGEPGISFSFEILERVEDQEDLTDRERHYVKKYNSLNYGYNRMMPGESPWGWSNAKAQLLLLTVEDALYILEPEDDDEDLAEEMGLEERVIDWVREGEVFSDAVDMYQPDRDGVQFLNGDQHFDDNPTEYRYLEEDQREFCETFEDLVSGGRCSRSPNPDRPNRYNKSADRLSKPSVEGKNPYYRDIRGFSLY